MSDPRRIGSIETPERNTFANYIIKSSNPLVYHKTIVSESVGRVVRHVLKDIPWYEQWEVTQ
jgi:hypothetical protein